MSAGDLYSRLGVSASATAEEIKTAYHATVRRFGPEANGSPGAAEEYRRVTEAFAVLSDGGRRSAYDAQVQQAGSSPLLVVRPVFSRPALPTLAEPQIVYVLVEVLPGAAAGQANPRVNLAVVIDRSTSMQGPRLDQVKAAVLQTIDNLGDQDSFTAVAFSDRAEVVIPAQRGPAERTLARARVSTLSAHGGTEMLHGLLCGLKELHKNLNNGAVNHLLVLTDGRTYGDEAECLMLASLAATDGIVISGLGIGEEWNDRFLDELTGRTGGTASYVRSTQSVTDFIRQRVHGLNRAYAERLSVEVALDKGVELLTIFKVQPEAGPVPFEQPLRLGSLVREKPLAFLLKFRVPPTEPGAMAVARLNFCADIVSLGRRDERLVVDLALPVARNTPPATPPPPLVDALSKLAQYQLQERAWQMAAEGDVVGAVERLKTLGTRLLATGQQDLARVALSEASRLERTQVLSEDAKKQLKYGTRALFADASGWMDDLR